MLAPITHILPVTLIRRKRVLPSPGKILVRQGQKVIASDIIAEANLEPEHRLLDIARALGISPDEADAQIMCQSGERLTAGDIIAGPYGLMRRVVRSPHDGRVILVGNGQVLMDVTGQLSQLKAGLSGEVIDLISDRGVTIEATGALIQGVWGNGKIGYGVMSILVQEPDQTLTTDQLDVSLRGAISLAAHCESPQVLAAAEELPLRGLILSSMSPELIKPAARMEMPVMVIDGFGRRPMNSVAFGLLTTSGRRDVSLNAEPWDHYGSTRPEMIITLPEPANVSMPSETDIFTAGQLVRVTRAPYAGKIGTITRFLGLTKLPSGIQALSAVIQLEDRENVTLPLVNLEVIA